VNNGQVVGKDIEKEYSKLINKKRGSKNFTGLVKHKNSEINRAIKQLVIDDVKTIIVEDLKNLRFKSKFGHKVLNKQQYWTYSSVLKKLEDICSETGTEFVKVSPSYTSQTCSHCGCTDRDSRQLESFVCTSCGYEIDADFNASINILNRDICKHPLTQEALSFRTG